MTNATDAVEAAAEAADAAHVIEVTPEAFAALVARVSALETAAPNDGTVSDLVADLQAFEERAIEKGISILELLAITAKHAIGVDLREPPVDPAAEAAA